MSFQTPCLQTMAIVGANLDALVPAARRPASFPPTTSRGMPYGPTTATLTAAATSSQKT